MVWTLLLLLILDEPFNAVDAGTVEKFRQLFKKLSVEQGATMVMTSHNKEDIQELCTKMHRKSYSS